MEIVPGATSRAAKERGRKREVPTHARAGSSRADRRVVGSFPDGQSALMLAAARLRHIAGTKWGNGATWT
jgi:hypothetical protein